MRGTGTHHLCDLCVALGVQCLEGQVFEFPLDLLNTEAVREGCVDVEGLLRRAPLLPLLHGPEGSHVVESIGEFDEEHAPIRRHGDQHLANRGGLLRFFRVEVEAIEFGDAIDDPSNLLAELGRNSVEGQHGVLDGIVEERCGDRGGIESEISHDEGYGDGVGDVGLTGPSHLSVMGSRSDLGSEVDERDVTVGVVGDERCERWRQGGTDVDRTVVRSVSIR